MKTIFNISDTETKQQLNILLAKPLKIPSKINRQALIYQQQLGLNEHKLKPNINNILVLYSFK